MKTNLKQNTQQNANDAILLIKEFLQTIKEQFYTAKKLDGGTQYQTFLVNKKYLFKTGNSNKIKAEFIYNNYYKGDVFVQNLLFCDRKYRFIVYKYIPGNIESRFPNTKYVFKQTMKFINNYKPYYETGYGDLIKPSNSWQEFLQVLIRDCKSYLKGILLKEHFDLIENSINTLQNYPFEKKLLHGDLRLENFIFENGTLTGIIDPYPMVGDSLYDKIYFLFSTIEMSKLITLHKIHKKLKQPKEKVKAIMLIVLCVKLKRIIKYKNNLNSFEYFKNLFFEVAKL